MSHTTAPSPLLVLVNALSLAHHHLDIDHTGLLLIKAHQPVYHNRQEEEEGWGVYQLLLRAPPRTSLDQHVPLWRPLRGDVIQGIPP